jgi:hypothetical protein
MSMDLVKTAEVFLVPSSFLVAALGAAPTDFHKTGVSLLGLAIGLLWLWCSREALDDLPPEHSKRSTRVRVLNFLPLFFTIGWLVSLTAHAALALQFVQITETPAR